MTADSCTYCVELSQEDREYLGLCIEFQSLSWVAKTPEDALRGIRNAVEEVILDMRSAREPLPEAIAI